VTPFSSMLFVYPISWINESAQRRDDDAWFNSTFHPSGAWSVRSGKRRPRRRWLTSPAPIPTPSPFIQPHGAGGAPNLTGSAGVRERSTACPADWSEFPLSARR
jgi:hypothetical protein